MSNETRISANRENKTATVTSSDGKLIAHVGAEQTIIEDGLKTGVFNGDRYREYFIIFELAEAMREEAGIHGQ